MAYKFPQWFSFNTCIYYKPKWGKESAKKIHNFLSITGTDMFIPFKTRWDFKGIYIGQADGMFTET